MALKEITPIEKTIHVIDEMIKELKLQRQELVALLPRRSPKPDTGYITDPRNGKKLWYNKRLQREYERKKEKKRAKANKK